MIPIARPLLGDEEKEAVLRVLDSGILAQNTTVAAFEEAFAVYCGARYAVATSGGTTALQIMLEAHGIGPGDEVITTPFTFIASANAILHAGATPVFVDVDPVTFCLDPDLVAAKISLKTKAILPVHLFGHAANMDALRSICARHHLFLLEDAAQAHGALYDGKKAGALGDASAFSFYATKNMTCGEGGIIVTDSEKVRRRAQQLRLHGCSPVRYYHDSQGYNYKMSEIEAAIGLCQLKKLDQFNASRQANAAYLCNALRDLDWLVLPSVLQGCSHVYHQFTVRVVGKSRDAFLAHLQEQGVGCGVFYPVPIHKQTFYRKLGYTDSLPVAERLASEVVSLPVHPGLSPDDLARIVSVVRSFS